MPPPAASPDPPLMHGSLFGCEDPCAFPENKNQPRFCSGPPPGDQEQTGKTLPSAEKFTRMGRCGRRDKSPVPPDSFIGQNNKTKRYHHDANFFIEMNPMIPGMAASWHALCRTGCHPKDPFQGGTANNDDPHGHPHECGPERRNCSADAGATRYGSRRTVDIQTGRKSRCGRMQAFILPRGTAGGSPPDAGSGEGPA